MAKSALPHWLTPWRPASASASASAAAAAAAAAEAEPGAGAGAETAPPDAAPPAWGEDWRLWRRAVDGHAPSAKRLVALLTPQALGLAMQLLGRREAAEDAVQDAFLRLWKSQARDTGQARLATYFNTIVLNRCRSALAQGQREQSTDPDDLAALQDGTLDDTLALRPPQQHLRDPHARLRAAVDALPPRQRMAIAMWAYADASVADIAQALALEPNAAHQLLHRAKRSLRSALQANDPLQDEVPRALLP